MPGEIISIILKNSVEYVLFYLATLRIGCIINPYPYNLESKDAIRYLALVRRHAKVESGGHVNDLIGCNHGARRRVQHERRPRIADGSR